MQTAKLWTCAAVSSFAVLGAFAASVAPDTGTIGTTVTAAGPGFGTKKGKVTLEGVGKPIGLKVTSWTDEAVAALVTKGRAGTFDVVVRPKGLDPVVVEDAFSLVPGEVASVLPEAPLPKQEVTIAGERFGTKKGTVKVGGKKARVKAWGDTEIRAVLHKKTPTGAQTVEVRNAIGVAGIAGPVEIGSGGGNPEPAVYKLIATLFRDRIGASGPEEISASEKGTGIFVEVSTDFRGTPVTLTFDLSNANRDDPASKVEPVLFEVTQGGNTWRAGPGAASVTLRARGAGRYSADFDGDLALVAGADDRDPLAVRGDFEVTIQ